MEKDCFYLLKINRDEKSVESDKDMIKQLFERAVHDFHCPELYLEYVQWACGVSIDFAREVW